MKEIEHKFLVNSGDFRAQAVKKMRIVQGFLNTHPERTVRVRLKGDKGFITVKGISNEAGTSRFEWEKEISDKEASALLELCEPGIIDKIRYEVNYRGHCFEVDEFEGDNKGLVVAEVELEKEEQIFDHPSWLGKEVTGIKRYYNSMLSKQPFKVWSTEEQQGYK